MKIRPSKRKNKMHINKIKNKEVPKKTAIFSLAAVFILFATYLVFEPVITKAVADSAVVSLSVTSEVTISSPADTSLTPSIPGVTGNAGSPATASLTWTVTTNNSTGFNMKLKSSSNPSLQLDGSNTFSDYTNGTPLNYTWQSPSSSAAWFGFTVEPATAADTATAFLDNGSDTCGTGAVNGTNTCWGGLATTDTDVINRSSATSSSGEAEVVRFRAESNAKFLNSGSYTATITATAAMN